jgi:hypothetical protein
LCGNLTARSEPALGGTVTRMPDGRPNTLLRNTQHD